MSTSFTPFFFIFLLFAPQLSAQDQSSFCGTEVSPAEIQAFLSIKAQLETQEQLRPRATNRSSDEVPVQVHAIRPSSGSANVLMEDITNALLRLNEAFDSAGLFFVPCGPVNYIDNDEWFNMDKSDASAIRAQHYFPGVINLYITSSIVGSTGGAIAGFAPLPYSPRTRGDYIFVNYSSTRGAASTVIHEMGHFYGLYHTHGNTVNCGRTDEFVDGSNCADAGDYICDTPADPGLNCFPETSVNAACMYTGTALDTNGMAYEPDVSNFMSYAPRQCRSYFSPGQMDRIISAKENYHSDLICQTETPCDLPQNLNVIAVRSNSCILLYSPVLGSAQTTIEIREAGGDWTALPGSPYSETNITIEDLESCTYYELRLQSNCYIGEQSAYSVITFRTRGCPVTCRPPSGLALKDTYYAALGFQWDKMDDAGAYQIRVREDGSSEWELGEWTTDTTAVFGLLRPGQKYHAQVRMDCNGSFGTWARAIEATTLIDPGEYCYSYGYADNNWMAAIELGDLMHTAEQKYGYWNHTDFVANLDLDEVFDLILTPGTSETTERSVFWQIWIDTNADNVFEETERLLQAEGNNQEPLVTTVLIPGQYPLGDYRMRIAMSEQAEEAACASDAVERDVKDFMVSLATGSTASNDQTTLTSVNVFPNPANEKLYLDVSTFPAAGLLLEIWTVDGKKVLNYQDQQGSDLVEVDIAEIPVGVYAYRLSMEAGVKVGRLVVRR